MGYRVSVEWYQRGDTLVVSWQNQSYPADLFVRGTDGAAIRAGAEPMEVCRRD